MNTTASLHMFFNTVLYMRRCVFEPPTVCLIQCSRVNFTWVPFASCKVVSWARWRDLDHLWQSWERFNRSQYIEVFNSLVLNVLPAREEGPGMQRCSLGTYGRWKNFEEQCCGVPRSMMTWTCQEKRRATISRRCRVVAGAGDEYPCGKERQGWFVRKREVRSISWLLERLG